MIRVALLGWTGFAGHNVWRELSNCDSIVLTALSRRTCDLVDFYSTARSLERVKPEWIINCAAKVGSLNYVTDYAADVIDVNTRMVLNLYQAALAVGAVVLNPIANCVYPGERSILYEDRIQTGEPHKSVAAYASTRRLMLAIATAYEKQYGIKTVNLITPNMYGPYDSTDPRKTHALNALIVKFMTAIEHRQNTVEIWGTGKPVREFLFGPDFARLVRWSISAKPDTTPVNLAQRKGYSIKELADMIVEITGYQGEVVYNNAYQDGALGKIMDDARFKRHFPNFSFTPIEDGIRQTIEYYRHVIK